MPNMSKYWIIFCRDKIDVRKVMPAQMELKSETN